MSFAERYLTNFSILCTLFISIASFFSRLSEINSHMRRLRAQDPYRGEYIVILDRYTFTARALWFTSFDKSSAPFRVRTNLSSRGRSRAPLTTNYINLLVARESERATVICGGGALHACSRAIDQRTADRVGRGVEVKGTQASVCTRPGHLSRRREKRVRTNEKSSQKGKWCTHQNWWARRCAVTYRFVYASNNAA